MAIIGYVEETDFTTWLSDRGLSITGAAATLLLRAFDWVELQQYKGRKTVSTQDDQWPRSGVYIDGFLIDSAAVPDEVKQLQMRYAYDLDKGNDAMGVSKQRKQSVSVHNAVSVTYADGSYQATISGQAQLLLGKLTETGGGMTFRVRRG